MTAQLSWMGQQWRAAIPAEPERSVAEWGRKHVRLIGSARKQCFDPDISPWTGAPLECTDDGVTRICTFVKPVQSGGSVVGEVALSRRIAKGVGGELQYNWEDDIKALERWDKRIVRILQANPEVTKFWPVGRHQAKKGLVIFPHCSLTVQGTFNPSNLDSDSISFQINEEVHNWEPGHLAKAYKRTTAVWNSFILNISNAGSIGDQLHQAFTAGTQECWEVKCPGCGLFHAMHTAEHKDGRPGGLKYDSEKCKREDGSYDYNKLAGTIYYEFDCCGHRLRDDVTERRQLSVGGKYCDPRNAGAHLSHRSFTLEAVSIDYISFLLLIQEKHEALRALKYGDPEPYKRYIQERECRFWDPSDRPLISKLEVATGLRKSREGLKERVLRGMSIDKQRGQAEKGETPHYWVVIRDWAANADNQLVFEGKVQLDDDLEILRERYEVDPRFVLIDSGWAASKVYQLCALYGYAAIKGDDRMSWPHKLDNGQRVQRIYSPTQHIDPFEGDNQGRAGKTEIDLILYSKQGIRDRYAWLRSAGHVKCLVPEDVSVDYRMHHETEIQQEFHHPKTGQSYHLWVKVHEKARNDLFVCECYQVLLAEEAGLLGSGIATLKIEAPDENAD